jgi:hypothetical protein
VALARHQVTDRDERLRCAAAPRPWRAGRGGQVRAEVHHARFPRAVRAGKLGDALAVGKHQAGFGQRVVHGPLAVGHAPGCVEHIAAVHRDDQRSANGARCAHAAHRIAGRNGVVRMDQVERERPVQAHHRDPQRWRRPGAPSRVRSLPIGRNIGHVGDLQPVEHLRTRLARQAGERARRRPRPCRERGARRHQAMQHDHAHLGARVARRQRLAMGPDTQHRIAPAGVELGDHEHAHRAHQRRCVVTVCLASAALT